MTWYRKIKQSYVWVGTTALFFILLCFISTPPEREKTTNLLLGGNLSIKENFSQGPYLNENKRILPEWPEFLFLQKNSLLASSPPTTIAPQVLAQIIGTAEIENEIIKHIVEPGETLWGISQEYGLQMETIIWANDLKGPVIRPGQELSILPVDGLIHIVAVGDTLGSIAEAYKAEEDKIAAINEISSPEEIVENQVLIIPDGQLPGPSPVRSGAFANLSTNNFYGQSHGYPYGQCTWWVAQRRAILGWGNAKDWLDNAIASGLAVCKGSYCVPRFGAVISLRGNAVYGHVGFVEETRGDKVVFSEMNYAGWGVMNYRTLKIGDPRIFGYIY